jgi:hypothetical protein
LPLPSIAQARAGSVAGPLLANGASTNVAATFVSGQVTGLVAGDVVAVLRRVGTGAAVRLGSAAVTGTAWTFTDTDTSVGGQGQRAYTVRTERSGLLGAQSAVYSVFVDSIPPADTAAVTGLLDGALGAIGAGGTFSDSTPAIRGTLSAPIAAGPFANRLQVERNGVAITGATPVFDTAGTSWTLQEPAVLAAGAYTYRARVVDALGNAGTLSAAFTVTLDLTTRTATVTGAGPTSATAPTGASPTYLATAPKIFGTINTVLLGGQSVQLVRTCTAGCTPGSTTLPGAATVTGTTWSFQDTLPANGRYTYQARIVTSGAPGTASASSAVVVVDTVAPSRNIVLVDVHSAYEPWDNADTLPSPALFLGQYGGAIAGSPARSSDMNPVFAVTIDGTGALDTTGTTTAPQVLELARGTGSFSAVTLITCPAQIPAAAAGNIKLCFRDSARASAAPLQVPTSQAAVPGSTAPSVTAANGVPSPSALEAVDYRVHLAKPSVSLVGASVGSKSLSYGYLNCNLARANVRSPNSHRVFTTATSISTCLGCHERAGDNPSPPSATNGFLAAPQGAYRFWCRWPPP